MPEPALRCAPGSVPAKLDHLVWATADLPADRARFHARTATEPAAGGRHAGLGTANHLLGLQGDRRYVELIHPDADADAPGPLGATLAELEQPGLYHWAVRSDALPSVHEIALALGLESTGPRTFRRRRPDGVELVWELLFVTGHDHGGLFPFFIDWHETPHPTEQLVPAAALTSFALVSPDAEPLAGLLARFGLEVSVTEGPAPAIEATLGAGEGVWSLPTASPFGRGLAP